MATRACRTGLAVVLAALTAASGRCSSGTPSTPGVPTPTSVAATAQAASAAGPVGSPTSDTTVAQNLDASAAVRQQLVVTWTTAQQLSAGDVSGTRPGSVYYGYLPSSGAYWAVSAFTPSPAAVQRSRGAADGGPLVHFQDGPWVFTRPAGAAWRLVTDSGGVLCPGEVPAPLASAWHLAASTDCSTSP